MKKIALGLLAAFVFSANAYATDHAAPAADPAQGDEAAKAEKKAPRKAKKGEAKKGEEAAPTGGAAADAPTEAKAPGKDKKTHDKK